MNKYQSISTPYETAYQQAIEKLASRDLDEVAFASSARLEGTTLLLNALGKTFRIEDKGKKVISASDNREVKIAEKIILLHYLVTADGSPLTRQEITFEHISGAGFYFPTYKARTINLIQQTFQNDLSRFLRICEQLGARVSSRSGSDSPISQDTPSPKLSPSRGEGRVRVKFLVLPNVPIDIIYWSGDKELPASCQIIYDANITHYLPLEDIVVLTELLVHQIIKSAKSNSSTGSALYDYH